MDDEAKLKEDSTRAPYEAPAIVETAPFEHVILMCTRAVPTPAGTCDPEVLNS